MINEDVLVLLTEIDKAVQSGYFKPTFQEKGFILKIGSIARTPQRISEKQGKWLEEIYRASQGHYKKNYRRE